MPRGLRSVVAAISSVLLASAWLAGAVVRSGSDAQPAVQQVGLTPGAPEVPVTGLGVPSGGAAPGATPARLSAASAGAAKAVSASTTASPSSIPPQAYLAYRRSAKILARVEPSCHLPWPLLAGIGRVESDHGQYGGSHLSSHGLARPAIIGVALDGSGQTAKISDTDHGRWDHDNVWDRAVGPMQFIPSTWRVIAVDGNNDGRRNPQNIYDAALAAGVYLCADGHDLGTPAGARAAVFSYNHSDAYVRQVLALADAYAHGRNVPPAASDFTPAPLDPGTPNEHARRTSTKVQQDANRTRMDPRSETARGSAKIAGQSSSQRRTAAARRSQDQRTASAARKAGGQQPVRAARKSDDQKQGAVTRDPRQDNDEQMLAQNRTRHLTEPRAVDRTDGRDRDGVNEPSGRVEDEGAGTPPAESHEVETDTQNDDTDTKKDETGTKKDDTGTQNDDTGTQNPETNEKPEKGTEPETPPTPAPSPTATSATVVCVKSQTQDGVLAECAQNGEPVKAPYACVDHGVVMRLGDVEDASPDLPDCVYPEEGSGP